MPNSQSFVGLAKPTPEPTANGRSNEIPVEPFDKLRTGSPITCASTMGFSMCFYKDLEEDQQSSFFVECIAWFFIVFSFTFRHKYPAPQSTVFAQRAGYSLSRSVGIRKNRKVNLVYPEVSGLSEIYFQVEVLI